MGVTGYNFTQKIAANWPAIITSAGCSVTARKFEGFIGLEADCDAEELVVTGGGDRIELWVEKYKKRNWICGFNAYLSSLSICLASSMVAAGCSPLIPSNTYLGKYLIFNVKPENFSRSDTLGSVRNILSIVRSEIDLAWSTRDNGSAYDSSFGGFWRFSVKHLFVASSVYVGLTTDLGLPFITVRRGSREARQLKNCSAVAVCSERVV